MFKTRAAMPRERLVGGFSRSWGQARYRSFHSDPSEEAPDIQTFDLSPFFGVARLMGTGRYKRENGEARTLTT